MAILSQNSSVGGYKILDYLLNGSFGGVVNSLSDLPTSPPAEGTYFYINTNIPQGGILLTGKASDFFSEGDSDTQVYRYIKDSINLPDKCIFSSQCFIYDSKNFNKLYDYFYYGTPSAYPGNLSFSNLGITSLDDTISFIFGYASNSSESYVVPYNCTEGDMFIYVEGAYKLLKTSGDNIGGSVATYTDLPDNVAPGTIYIVNELVSTNPSALKVSGKINEIFSDTGLSDPWKLVELEPSSDYDNYLTDQGNYRHGTIYNVDGKYCSNIYEVGAAAGIDLNGILYNYDSSNPNAEVTFYLTKWQSSSASLLFGDGLFIYTGEHWHSL